MYEQDLLVELAKRRGFFFPATEAYSGTAGFYTYGPNGTRLKQNLVATWREQFVMREGHFEVDTPTVLPESVLDASGHLDGFSDMLIMCGNCGTSHRADQLLENATDIEAAETLAPTEIQEHIEAADLACPNCGAALAGEPVTEFDLMFETSIGPGSGTAGYLRPETAQGIFVEFPRLKQYAREQLPFGVAQVGRAYRNEISPRRSLLRVREFTQAEIEQFVSPEENEAPLNRVADVTITLYPTTTQQTTNVEYVNTTVSEAVDNGIVLNEWIAYYLGVTWEWCSHIGIDTDRLRFRQHLPDERAHYASDTWDAEVQLDGEWTELAGIAHRGTYDLSNHAAATGESFTVFEQYDEPVTRERVTIDPDMSYLGPEFGNAATEVVEALQQLADRNPDAFDAEEISVEVDGETHRIPTEVSGFHRETQTITGEQMVPSVIEPSFGIDRLVYTILAHGYREDEIDGQSRTYLALSPDIAPIFVGVFPLGGQNHLASRASNLTEELRAEGFTAAYDDSGSIGRRYRRQDEIGTPFCVTIDHRTSEDETVTLRERNSTDQLRLPIEEVMNTLQSLQSAETSFDALLDFYEMV
jgi:glycyl-tRNA synthetase